MASIKSQCLCMISSKNLEPWVFTQDLGQLLKDLSYAITVVDYEPPIYVSISCPIEHLYLACYAATRASLVVWAEDMYERHLLPEKVQSVAQKTVIDLLAEGPILGPVQEAPAPLTFKVDDFTIMPGTPVQLTALKDYFSAYSNVAIQVEPMQPEPYVPGVIIKLGDDCKVCGMMHTVGTETAPLDDDGKPTFKHTCSVCHAQTWDYSIDPQP